MYKKLSWDERIAQRVAVTVYFTVMAETHDIEEAHICASAALKNARKAIKAKRENRIQRLLQRQLQETMYCVRWQ